MCRGPFKVGSRTELVSLKIRSLLLTYVKVLARNITRTSRESRFSLLYAKYELYFYVMHELV